MSLIGYDKQIGTVDFNGRPHEYIKDYDWKKFFQEVKSEESHHVDYWNRQYRNRKKQIKQWSKETELTVKKFIEDVYNDPRYIIDTYKDHEFIIYLTEYRFAVEIKCNPRDIIGLEFQLFFNSDPEKTLIGRYGTSRDNDAMYYKDTHSISWDQETSILDDKAIHEKFRSDYDKSGSWRRNRLIRINDVIPNVKTIIDDFMKQQEHDYEQRAKTFGKIYHLEGQLSDLYRHTPDGDYQELSDFHDTIRENDSSTLKVTNQINKNLYERYVKLVDDMPIAIQNYYYGRCISTIRAFIRAKAYEQRKSLEGLEALYKQLEELK